LYADARRILLDQLLITPGNPLILELLTEIDERIAQGGEGQPRVEQRDSDFNLKEQLNELGRVVRESQMPPKMGAPKPAVDVESVFAKFKAGVKAQVSDADSATHYDLGIAYKDMNLFNDAVEELKLAAQDVTRECNCYAMIGLIYAEQKQWEQARKYYSKGLGAVRRTPNQETALYYELGHVSENAEHLDQAAYYFRQVLRRDANFRDARDRLSKLRNSWAPPEARGPGPANQDEEVDRAFDELLNDAE
jgi:pilus assembly protein FimV